MTSKLEVNPESVVAQTPVRREPYDVLILGAGPAGLSAAIYMGRYQRPTLVLSEKKPLTRWHRPTAHNVLGYPAGIMRSQILEWGRDHACQYESVSCVHATVVAISQRDGLFVATDQDGETYGARGMILAVGVEHELPDVPDILDYAGRSIFHCPECDGYKVRDKRVVVIGSGRGTAGFALGLCVWTPFVTVCTGGREPGFDEQCVKKLAEQHIGVMTGKIERLVGNREEGKIEKMVLAGGEEVECEGAFSNLGEVPPTGLLRQLPLDLHKGRYVNVDNHQQTNIPLCFAAGDICSHSQTQVSVAMGQGATAAIWLHKELLPECYRLTEKK